MSWLKFAAKVVEIRPRSTIGKEYRLKPDLTVGLTEEYASRMEKSDAPLLDKLKQADVAFVAWNPSSLPECAASA